MIVFEKKQKADIQAIIDDKFSKKLQFNNYFGIELLDCEINITTKTLLIRKKHGDFYRLYILSEDLIQLQELMEELGSNHVVNVPTKKPILEFEKIMQLTGFILVAKYNRYYYSKIKKNSTFKNTYAIQSDFDQIKSILYETFSPVTGHLPSDNDLYKMIQENQILVNRGYDKISVNGIIGFFLERKKCYLSFWADNNGGGLELLYSVFSLLKEREIDYVYFWVNEENTNTIKIHKMLGALPDGLIDYIFKK